MANKKPKKIETRRQFVEQVAETLSVKSEGTQEAFVFGISGRWGEGKSYFLDELEETLRPIPVVRVNPWKYAQDQNSLLRSFLKELFDKKDYGWLRRAYYRWRLKLKTLEYDFSTKNIRFSVLLPLIGISLLLGWWYYYSGFYPEVKASIARNKALLVAITIPLAIAAAQAISVSQRSSKSVETFDKFDKLFEGILQHSYPRKKDSRIVAFIKKLFRKPAKKKVPEKRRLVVFVDDLDRLTAEKAISVLDTLRTFFDKDDLAFVVACDHTIMEEHLGRRLKPNATSDNQQKEEGRRFLQKMFNVYWRLPLPTEAEMKSYIEWLTSTNTEQGRYLGKFIKGSDREQLQSILFGFFEKNFRHINRFIDRLVFTFRVVESQEKALGNKELSTHPMLIVRVLLLEALTNPLFEKILNDPSILEDLEELHYKDEAGKVTDKLASVEYAEATHQKLVPAILNSTEGFFDENGFQASVEDYIYLASNSNEEDKSGLAPPDFVTVLKSSPEEILPAILRYKTRTRFSNSIKLVADRSAATSADVFYALFKELTDAMPGLPTNSALHQPVLDVVDQETFYAEFATIPVEKQIEFIMSLDEWINMVNKLFPSDQLMHVAELIASTLTTPLVKNIDFPEEGTLGEFISDVVFLWFTNTYQTDPSSALTTLAPRIKGIHPNTLSSYSVRVAEPILDRLMQESDTSFRSAELKIVISSQSHLGNLQSNLIQAIKQGDETAWSIYTETNAIDTGGTTIILNEQAQMAVVEYIATTSSENEFITALNFADGKLSGTYIDQAWDIILRDKRDLLKQSLHSLMTRYNFGHLSPNANSALVIIDMVLDVIDEDEAQAQQLLSYVRKTNWLFVGVQKLRKTRISPRVGDRVNTIQQPTKDALKAVVSEWEA